MTKPKHPPVKGITYHPTYRPGKDQHTKGELKEVAVHLDGRLVGRICHPPASNGWHYLPKGKKHADGGPVFISVVAVKLSLGGPTTVTAHEGSRDAQAGLLDPSTLAAIIGGE